jgi:hypothetical protein
MLRQFLISGAVVLGRNLLMQSSFDCRLHIFLFLCTIFILYAIWEKQAGVDGPLDVIIIIISCLRFSFFPGTSALEPVVNPITQASSLSL